MNIFNKKYLFAALLAIGTGSSFAQFGGGMGGMSGRHGRGGDASSPASTASQSSLPSAQVNQAIDRLFDLRIRLLITPEQSNAWDAFQVLARKWAEVNIKGPMTAVVDGQSALQFMQLRLSDAQNRYTLMESLNDSVKKLYSTLSSDQQRIADQYLPPTIR